MPRDNFLVDTDIIIDALRGFEEGIKLLSGFSPVNISLVTAAELIEGCRNREELKKIQTLLSAYQVLSVNEIVARQAFKLVVKYHLKQSLAFDDALIAATAKSFHLILLTRNTKHYQKITGLQLQKPY